MNQSNLQLKNQDNQIPTNYYYYYYYFSDEKLFQEINNTNTKPATRSRNRSQ
ncbi:hypothetical protein HanRHA438_Chr07g0317991 [Helianthus annuus]|nr:hypothetical protein HanRHA438_Chr07g0317991 [Helianthus annuus]